MARKRSYKPKRKRRSYRSKARRYFRRRDKRMPLSVGVGLATSVLAPPCAGYSSALSAIQYGSIPDAVQSFVRSWTGINIPTKDGQQFSIDLTRSLNPFDFSDAPAWKATLWSSLVMRVTKKITHVDPLSKVPVVNKYLKFS